MVSDQAWADDLPLPEHLAALGPACTRSTACWPRTGRCTCTWTGGRSTTCDSCWTRCSARSGSSTSSSGPTTTAAGRGTAGRASTTRSCGTRRATRGPSTRDQIDRIPYMAPGLVGPEKAARGKLPTDVWWMTIVPPASAERTGYPTQKPVRLLERIVAASSRPGTSCWTRTRAAGRPGSPPRGSGAVAARGPEPRRGGDRAGAPRCGRGRGEARMIEAITLDFGNTLVPVPAGGPAWRRGGNGAGDGRPTRARSTLDEVLRALGRGARAPVPRGGPAVARGGPGPADRADPRPPARDDAAARR